MVPLAMVGARLWLGAPGLGMMLSMAPSHLGPCWEHAGSTHVGMLTLSGSQVLEQSSIKVWSIQG